MYGFAAAETYVDQLPALPFYIHVDDMSGGGVEDTLTSVAQRVMKHLRESGVAGKAKEAALEQTKKLGAKAIDKVADQIETEASKRSAICAACACQQPSTWQEGPWSLV